MAACWSRLKRLVAKRQSNKKCRLSICFRFIEFRCVNCERYFQNATLARRRTITYFSQKVKLLEIQNLLRSEATSLQSTVSVLNPLILRQWRNSGTLITHSSSPHLLYLALRRTPTIFSQHIPLVTIHSSASLATGTCNLNMAVSDRFFCKWNKVLSKFDQTHSSFKRFKLSTDWIEPLWWNTAPNSYPKNEHLPFSILLKMKSTNLHSLFRMECVFISCQKPTPTCTYTHTHTQCHLAQIFSHSKTRITQTFVRNTSITFEDIHIRPGTFFFAKPASLTGTAVHGLEVNATYIPYKSPKHCIHPSCCSFGILRHLHLHYRNRPALSTKREQTRSEPFRFEFVLRVDQLACAH